MKAKIQAILTSNPQNDAAYTRVIRDMPEIIKPQDKTLARLGADASRYEIHLASQIRTSSFSYQVPAIRRTPNQNGDYDDDHNEEPQDDTVLSPARSDNGMIDPRLTGASFDTGKLHQETTQLDMAADEMNLDTSSDAIPTP